MTTSTIEQQKLRIVATYERVSSEDQRERDTIKTQQDELARRLGSDPSASLFRRYSDNGITGTISMAERPSGKQLIHDAENRLFNELWFYNTKRLGRDKIELLKLQRHFENLGIKLISLQEGELTGIGFDIAAVLADYDRKYWLKLSADGMNRAAREGRYTGGIVPLGFKVVGEKQTAHLEPSDEPLWCGQTEADVVRRIYNHLAEDGWSCVKISEEFNRLQIPTDYVHDNRKVSKGERKEHTQGVWRPGHIRNMVVNPIYKGVVQFGRRTNKPGGREIIRGKTTGIVTDEIWQAAQETLKRNRVVGPSKGRIYLLKSVIKCGKCGLTYVSCLNRGQVWYRCNGHLTGRGPLEGRCSSKDIKGVHLEPVIWADIESFIRHPGEDIIKELSSERDCDKSIDTEQIERQNLEKALEQLASRRKNAIDLRTRDRISDNELDELLAQISKEQSKAEERLSILCREAPEPTPPVGDDILAEIRSRLANLTPLEKQEIVRLLVKRVTINTEGVDKNRTVKAVVEYRFTQPVAVPTGSGKDSLHR